MNKITSFFKLIRCTNLLMIAIMMLLVYYCLMSPLFMIDIVGIMPLYPAFLLLLLSMIFIVAGGYIINDIFDVEIDRINKPDKLLITNAFSYKEAKLFYGILTSVGLTCGLISSVLILGMKFYLLFLILVLLVCLLYSYSANYKKKMIIGNLIVSLSVSFAVFLPWLFEVLYLSNNTLILYAVKDTMLSILPFVLIYTVFAFMMTLLREIVKDAEDYKGDIITHCRTIPIVYGIRKMNIMLIILTLLTWLILLYYMIILLRIKSYITLGIMFVIWNTLPFSIFQLSQKGSDINYHNYSVFLKILMLFGILSMLFI